MKLENVSGLVWDLDGTLLNSLDIFVEALTDVTNESGHAMPSRQQILNNYHGSLSDSIKLLLDIESDEELQASLDLFLKHQVRHYDGDLAGHLYPDALNLVRAAGAIGIRQMITTNRNHETRGNASPRYIVANTPLADYIEDVYCGDEVTLRKPDRAAVGDWMQRCLVGPAELVVIGDQSVDAQLAINLGARALLVERGGDIPYLEKLERLDSVYVVASLDEVELTR